MRKVYRQILGGEAQDSFCLSSLPLLSLFPDYCPASHMAYASFSFCATHGACPCPVFFGWFGVVPTMWRLLPGVQVRLTLPFALLTLQSWRCVLWGWSNQQIHIFGTRLPWNLEISSLIILSHFGSCLSEGWSSWCGLSMNQATLLQSLLPLGAAIC